MLPWTCSIHQAVCQHAGHIYLALYGIGKYDVCQKHFVVEGMYLQMAALGHEGDPVVQVRPVANCI